jgi:hypothetical protein
MSTEKPPTTHNKGQDEGEPSTKSVTTERLVMVTRGNYSLVRIDGTLVIEQGGVPLLTEDDGYEFNERVGIVFGWQVELAVAAGLHRKVGRADNAQNDNPTRRS